MSTKKLPTLFLFPQPDDPNSTASLFNIKQNKSVSLNSLKNSSNIHCAGSSFGWLVILKENQNLYLLNPFLGLQFDLPILEYPSQFSIESRDFVTKSLLTCDPIEKKSDCKVVVIYGRNSRIGYCKLGDDESWVDLDFKNKFYCDIIYYNNLLLALSDKGSVEIWDFDGNLIKQLMNMEIPFPIKTTEIGKSMKDLIATNHYIVESKGNILLIVRFIGEFVNADGKPIYESDLLTDEDTHPLVCPYRTLFFHVYRLDFSDEQWIEIELLGDDQAVLLGGSESKSVSVRDCDEYKGNRIYFTDDYWERIDEDYLYGGHDIGVFDLENQSVTPIYVCDKDKILPTPIWVVPN